MKPHDFAYLPLAVGATFSAAALAQTVNTITFTGTLEQQRDPTAPRWLRAIQTRLRP